MVPIGLPVLGIESEILTFGRISDVIPHLNKILAAYDLKAESALFPIGNGLIHKTWKLSAGSDIYVLQNINKQVFREPQKIAENLRLLEAYLKKSDPTHLFVAPLPTVTGERMCIQDGLYYRLFRFVDKSNTYDVVSSADLAYEAALQFGRFSKVFAGFDSETLNATIPQFHDLGFRELQLREALVHGNIARIIRSRELIQSAQHHTGITDEFLRIQKGKLINKRVTHHDTKISNVLFNPEGRGITVIDLDTVMAGYFISDLGDMMRTYLSPASEEENDFTQIDVRPDFFEAIVSGFLDQTHNVLTAGEKEFIFYSGAFLIYMQAIRFLTDYLNNDAYYGARYDDHNFVRAGNQFTLLDRYMEKEDIFRSMVNKVI